jgi:hypothetical protein
VPLPGRQRPLTQTLSQPPQLTGSSFRSTHEPPQFVSVASVQTQLAFTQFWSAAQAGLQPAAPPVVPPDVPPVVPPVLWPIEPVPLTPPPLLLPEPAVVPLPVPLPVWPPLALWPPAVELCFVPVLLAPAEAVVEVPAEAPVAPDTEVVASDESDG